ncbi:MAG: hypothetical protein OHK0028_07270 [Deltaproteobacteria bacterium]
MLRKKSLLLVLVSVIAYPAGSAFALSPGERAGSSTAGISSALMGTGVVIRSERFSLCPSIADTAQVKDRAVDYLRTREFAEAVNAVANGSSRFSPTMVPADWKVAAADWKTSVAATGKPKVAVVSGAGGVGGQRAVLVSPNGVPMEPILLGTDRTCDPQLLFRASIEYRTRVGQEDLPLLYPHVVRQAAAGLGKTVTAKLDLAARNAKRLEDTALRIQQAEQMGAGECQPRELARAKAEAAVARQGITELDFDPGMAEEVIARAETLSGNLLAARRYAASRGIRCITE